MGLTLLFMATMLDYVACVDVRIQALNANGVARGGGERVLEYNNGLRLAAFNASDTSQMWSKTDDPNTITFTLKLGYEKYKCI